MSNLVAEVLLRLVKPIAATLLAAALFLGLAALGASPSAELLLLCWIAAAAFILLVQESPL